DPEPHSSYTPPTLAPSFVNRSRDEIAEQIRIREEELDRREKDLLIREEMVTGENILPKNWPACKPVLRHDIANDTDAGLSRKVAYAGYTLWILYCIALGLNLIVMIVTVSMPVSGGIKENIQKFQYVVYCLVFLIVVPPANFAVYWQLYKAQVEKTVPRFILFFLGYAVTIIFTLFLVSGWCTPGIYVAILYFPLSSEYGLIVGFVLSIFMAIVWALFTLAFIVVFILNIKLARQHNHSINSAIEFTKKAAVGTAASLTSSAISSSINAQTEV
ncbi:SCAMP6, partial [Acrasis kona]